MLKYACRPRDGSSIAAAGFRVGGGTTGYRVAAPPARQRGTYGHRTLPAAVPTVSVPRTYFPLAGITAVFFLSSSFLISSSDFSTTPPLFFLDQSSFRVS